VPQVPPPEGVSTISDLTRTTINIDSDKLTRLKIMAAEQQTTMSELIRNAIDEKYFTTTQEGNEMQSIIENLLKRHECVETYHDGYTYGITPVPAVGTWHVWGAGAALSELVRTADSSPAAAQTAIAHGYEWTDHSWAVEILCDGMELDAATRLDAAVEAYALAPGATPGGYHLTVARESLPAHSREVYNDLSDLVAQLPSDITWYPGEECSCDVCDLLHRLDPEHGGNGYGVYKCNIDVYEHSSQTLREALAAVFGADDYLEPSYLVANQPGHLAWEGEACPGDLEEICLELDRRGVNYDLDVAEVNVDGQIYEIVTELTPGGNEWTTDGLGASDANEFASVEEAIEAIEALKRLGPEWACARYGVRVIGERYPVYKERS